MLRHLGIVGRTESGCMRFHALALRMLEYELNEGFEWVISHLLIQPEVDTVRPSHRRDAHRYI